MTEFPYPMWVIECEDDGFVCTIWEQPGTGCSYIEHCPSCGSGNVSVTKVTDSGNHSRIAGRADARN